MTHHDPFGLSGKLTVVTGAGSGIGRAVALAFAANGAQLALLDVDAAGLAETEAQIAALGATCLALTCDVAEPGQVQAAADAIHAANGPAHVLVNNAGIIRPGSMADMDVADWTRVISINLTGCYLCARAFGAEMRKAGRGSIVNMASIASTYPTPFTGAYSVSKAGVAMLSRQLAIEWGPDGVRSNAICPGMILTELSRSMYSQPGVEEARSATIPMRRIGQPEDIAEAALYLASDRSSYVTGAEIAVDGGFPRNLLGLVPRVGYGSAT